MLDVYFGNMDGVEVHAETPEEEQEVAFILNSALSGKTTFLGGCLCPSEADSTVSKGFRLMLSEGTDLYVTPALDVDGTKRRQESAWFGNRNDRYAGRLQ